MPAMVSSAQEHWNSAFVRVAVHRHAAEHVIRARRGRIVIGGVADGAARALARG